MLFNVSVSIQDTRPPITQLYLWNMELHCFPSFDDDEDNNSMGKFLPFPNGSDTAIANKTVLLNIS
jgi:hypothetical protein